MTPIPMLSQTLSSKQSQAEKEVLLETYLKA